MTSPHTPPTQESPLGEAVPPRGGFWTQRVPARGHKHTRPPRGPRGPRSPGTGLHWTLGCGLLSSASSWSSSKSRSSDGKARKQLGPGLQMPPLYLYKVSPSLLTAGVRETSEGGGLEQKGKRTHRHGEESGDCWEGGVNDNGKEIQSERTAS